MASTIKHISGNAGGYLSGRKHTQGGIKAINKSTGQPLEMEGGEVVITAPAVSDRTLVEFEGRKMTKRQVLSAINESGGGVSFASGGKIPKKIKYKRGVTYKVGGLVMDAHQVVKHCGCGCAHTGGMRTVMAKGGKIKTGASRHDLKKEREKIKTDLRMDNDLSRRSRQYRMTDAEVRFDRLAMGGHGHPGAGSFLKRGGSVSGLQTVASPRPAKQTFSNAYELNKAIETLLDQTPDDSAFTVAGKELIMRYSGYGGLEKFGATGKGLLYEYYTPGAIAEKMWALAYKYGYKGGQVLEPAAGIGEFVKYATPESIVTAYEINPYSARILKILYPAITVRNNYFEEVFLKNRDTIRGRVDGLKKYDLVIGNPPYGEFSGTFAGMGEKQYTRASNYIDYFIFRGLDLLQPGGLLVYIVGAEVASGGKCFLSQGMNRCKQEIMEKSALIDAYRLPNGVFDRTDVLTDIMVLQKK